MAIALVLVKLQHCLSNGDNVLVDTEFANTRQPVSVNNRPDVQNWIKTLYDKAGQRGTKSAYYKLDPALLWFINTSGCCQRLILAYFMYNRAFQHLAPISCCDNYIYARVPPKTVPEFQIKKVTTRMSMMYYQTTEWEEICLEKEYGWRIINEVTRSNKTSNIQWLACEAALNNFASSTWPDDYTDKLMFPLSGGQSWLNREQGSHL